MNLVLTGSLGNISKPLAIELLKMGHQVTVISRNPEKSKAIEALGAHAAIGTIEDVNFLKDTFKGANAVYCMLPAFDFFDSQTEVMDATRRIVGNYVAAIKACSVKKVVHLSSVGAHTEKGVGLLAFHHLAETLFKELPAEYIIKHMRPVSFFNNLCAYKTMIRGKGILGLLSAIKFGGFKSVLRGQIGLIAANYGGSDQNPWVSPLDIAEVIAQELTNPFDARMYRYIASEELTCDEIATVLGTAIGKPWLKWWLMTDDDMLHGLKMFGMPESRAMGIMEMNAGMHNGIVNEDYYKNRPTSMGKVTLKDFAKDFVSEYNDI